MFYEIIEIILSLSLLFFLLLNTTTMVYGPILFDTGDQNYSWAASGDYGSSTDGSFAMQFKPTQNNIAIVGLNLTSSGSEDITVILAENYNVAVPSWDPLGSVTQTVSTGGWQNFTFSAPVAVTIGQDYQIIVLSPNGYTGWIYDINDPYSNGGTWGEGEWQPNADLHFATYYDSTLPETDKPLIVGFMTSFIILGLIYLRKRNN